MHRLATIGVSACFGIATAACAHIDAFGTRATNFNAEVADAQNATLLINVMRAANRFPMHFTELSTLSGTSQVSGTAALSTPFATLNNGSGVLSASPSLTVSQSPTFNVAVLETQEFYQGVMAPLTPEKLSVYVSEGLPRELVFTLGVGQIFYQDVSDATELSPPAVRTIANNFHSLPAPPADLCGDGRKDQHACFAEILHSLVRRGLTIEKVSENENIGPLVDVDSFVDLKNIKELDAQKLRIVSVDMEACEKKADTCPDGLGALPSRS